MGEFARKICEKERAYRFTGELRKRLIELNPKTGITGEVGLIYVFDIINEMFSDFPKRGVDDFIIKSMEWYKRWDG